MKPFKFAILSLTFGFTISCQQKPTVAVTDSGILVQNKDYRKLVQPNSVVFDTRSPFEFNTNKIPGSINLPKSDFESSKDPLDSARRLSLYGVDPTIPVVIVGDGHGDEQKLAWEFVKLGVLNIETLRSSIFRMLNLKPEPPKQNIALWKPSGNFGELSLNQFKSKIENYKPSMESKAKSAVYQGFPVGQVLKKRALVLTIDKEWPQHSNYLFADHFQLKLGNFFDQSGLFNPDDFKKANDLNVRNYEVIFLFDSTVDKALHAYAIARAGAKNLFLVY